MTDFSGPSWDNSREYIDFESQLIHDHIQEVKDSVNQIKNLSVQLRGSEQSSEVNIALQISEEKWKSIILSSNLLTYANCALSVNCNHAAAKKLMGKVQILRSDLYSSLKEFDDWLVNADQSLVDEYTRSESTQHESFSIHQERKLKDHRLSINEEKLLTSLGVSGLTAWGDLYSEISSSLSCTVEIGDIKQTMGMAQAAALLSDSDDKIRKHGYQKINESWKPHLPTCAASINAIAGWRLSLYKKRSTIKEMHFLEPPLHSGRLNLASLEAMLSAISSAKETAQEVIKTKAKLLDLSKLGPWDLFAPAPNHSSSNRMYTFEEAIDVIRCSFNEVSPEMGQFVDLMVEKKWIDGSTGKEKRPGAYCTKFPLSRTPRVYMTYSGTIKDVITLAHELGHAFHNWVMKELPLSATMYPMTLAETASILAQTITTEELLKRAKSDGEKLEVLWSDLVDAEAFLLNIPARFEFERSFYERRSSGPLSVDELSTLMNDSWQKWYGESLSEYNEIFWATKLHYHITGLSFYNFPYSFGYLFSLGVLSQRKNNAKSFFEFYVNLLKDTGTMTCEEVTKKHLKTEINEDFWRDSISNIVKKIEYFKEIT